MSSRRFNAECCCHLQLELGEGVRWDDRRGELVWVDVHRGRLHAAAGPDARLDQVTVLDVGGPLTAVVDRTAQPGKRDLFMGGSPLLETWMEEPDFGSKPRR